MANTGLSLRNILIFHLPSPNDLLVRRRRPSAAQQKSEREDESKHRLSNPKITLCSYDRLPTWYQDNESNHIRHGYRPETRSASACIHSWTYVHNETFNIFSHMAAAVLFTTILLCINVVITRNYPGATFKDRIMFAAFLSTAVLAFTLSFMYHTLMSHSLPVSNLWLRLDYVGIITLTFGGFLSGIYVGFYCEPELQKLYWSMVPQPPFQTLDDQIQSGCQYDGSAFGSSYSHLARSSSLAS